MNPNDLINLKVRFDRLKAKVDRLIEEAIETMEITPEQALKVAEALGIEDEVDLEEFRMGLEVELEHTVLGVEVADIGMDLLEVGKIAYAHLLEDPKYYTKLSEIED